MAITVVEPRTAAPPGYGRAYASVPVQVSRQGVLRPGSLAQWRPLVPGTDDQYTGPLFGSPDSVAPLLFPQVADERGLIEVWAPEPVRIEVVAWVNGHAPVRRMLDLQFTEDFSREQGDTLWVPLSHLTAQNAHPISTDAGNVIEWRPGGLFVPVGAVPPEYLTQTEGDERYLSLAGGTLSGSLSVQGDVEATSYSGGALASSGNLYLSAAGYIVPPVDISQTLGHPALRWLYFYGYAAQFDASLTVGANAVSVSPDAGNSLEWRANGFYVATLEARVAALEAKMTGHLHEAGDWDYLAGAMVMPEDIP